MKKEIIGCKNLLKGNLLSAHITLLCNDDIYGHIRELGSKIIKSKDFKGDNISIIHWKKTNRKNVKNLIDVVGSYIFTGDNFVIMRLILYMS